ncbi:MAG: ATP-binding protein [Hormoscilla sp. GM7CHS1pb]|nr:ATP-binding protein [Hormoscilla sp. GM7CHS1pb]
MVVQNLVTNAVEAFDAGGGRIEITVEQLSDWVQVKISDNGPGIPEEIRDRFFEAFVTQEKQGGTGLGTAIAKSIIDAHGGQIIVKNFK